MNENHKMTQEIEIKLDLGSFTNYLKLIGFLGHIEDETRQINAFFDSNNRKLANAGWALRVRAESRRGLVTIKSIATNKSIATIRQEVETQINRQDAIALINLQADVMELPAMPVEYLRQEVGKIKVERLVQFENVRQRKLFKINDQNYMLEIDKTEFNDGSVEYELELELSDTSKIETIEANLRKLFLTLDIPFIRQTESKFARALKKADIL
ncbi:MAG: CYTH domain-containing protein [candidate division Zixibacteria bacterium]|nr:CYTH domain-containing protein [candidate division Zixibacteria bacterium]